ncbi:LOW QUALITY PROTEIN: hypothetical protein YC2023_061498 [Brassica napus]
MPLSASPVPQTGVPASVTQPSSLSVLVSEHSRWPPSLLGFPELQERQRIYGNHDSVIHGFIHAGRANHYMPFLKAGSIVKVDRFEVARCSSMYKITEHPFLIRFIPPTIIDEVITNVVEQIRSVQGSDITKETTRVVIRLLIDP